MKLSKIISCLVPISLIGVTTPILTSCNNNTFTLTFGDSINCWLKDDEYTKIVKYNDYNSVASAVRKNADIETEKESVSITDLNNSRKNNFQKVYWDFVASLILGIQSKEIIYLHNVLNDSGDGFTTFEFAETEKDDPSEFVDLQIASDAINFENFEYTKYEDDDVFKVGIKLSFNTITGTSTREVLSYTYQNCTATD